MAEPGDSTQADGHVSDPFRLLLDEVGAFVYTTDRDGRYTYANRLVLELLGQPLEAIIGKSFTDFVDIGEDTDLRATDRQVLRDGITVDREESNLVHATGELRTYHSIKKPLRDASGAIIGLLGISYDITEKKRLESKVNEQKELLDTVLDNVGALVYMKDMNRRFVYANQRMADAFGLPVSQVLGKLDSELMPKADADRFWAQDQRILAAGERYAGEASLAGRDGQMRHYWSVIVPFVRAGDSAVIGFSTDITELHMLKEELQRQATTDSLTGIANRRCLYARAEEEMARCRRHGLPLSLLAIDLDHFKYVNDQYGHQVGDQVLQTFAHCSQFELRAEDLIARTGGEEFCVLLPDTDVEAAYAAAERIRMHLLHCCVDPDNPELRITASFGVATLRADDRRFGSLYSRADHGLYSAKQQGRNQTVVQHDDPPRNVPANREPTTLGEH